VAIGHAVAFAINIGPPHPHTRSGFVGITGQPSLQFGVTSPSESVSGIPQPHAPGAILLGSFGHRVRQSTVPSPSVSGLVR
jgi:hypothetical protein